MRAESGCLRGGRQEGVGEVEEEDRKETPPRYLLHSSSYPAVMSCCSEGAVVYVGSGAAGTVCLLVVCGRVGPNHPHRDHGVTVMFMSSMRDDLVCLKRKVETSTQGWKNRWTLEARNFRG